MDDVDLEWFDQVHIPNLNRPLFTIQKRGTSTLNRAALEALGNPDAVMAGFDRKRNIVAFKGVDPEAKGAYVLRKVGASSTSIFSLRSFVNKYDIPNDRSMRYTGVVQDGILLFPLDSGVPTVR